MTDNLAERFETHRDHLRAVAYRMLGTPGEADDAVQEAWLRLQRTDAGAIDNLGGWLTTVVARVCLDLLRTRTSRREEPLAPQVAERPGGVGPDSALRLADSIGTALLVVLDHLAPAERVAFVLHDVFDVPFDDIAEVVGRTPAATRQLASRARRRVQGASSVADADRARQRGIVDAFLAASRDGDFDALLGLLDPEVVLRADPVAVATAAARAAAGAPAPALAPQLRGARVVAESFHGRARAARSAIVDGVAGAAWVAGGQPRAVFSFRFAGDVITAIELIMEPDTLAELDVVVLAAPA